jgi:hypothetical protein
MVSTILARISVYGRVTIHILLSRFRLMLASGISFGKDSDAAKPTTQPDFKESSDAR